MTAIPLFGPYHAGKAQTSRDFTHLGRPVILLTCGSDVAHTGQKRLGVQCSLTGMLTLASISGTADLPKTDTLSQPVTWVISPIPLRENAHFGALRVCSGISQLLGEIRNTFSHSQLERLLNKSTLSRASGCLRALLQAEVLLKAGSKPVRSHRHSAKVRALQARGAGLLAGAVLVLFGLVVTPGAFAKVHPVPLDKNVDAAQCLQCHADKTKGKAVHSAIAMGCTSCHEVRVNKDVTRVKLITAVPYKLCLTCHSDKDAAQINGHIHQPAIKDCLTCHDAHSSENKNQLLKATAGDKKDNLCLSCHTQGTNVPAKGSRHAALDMGCDTCHVTHKTGAEPTAQNQFHLAKMAPALCIDCHDPKDASLQKSHQNQPFGAANCLQCHDPHQSASPKLMAKFQHPPFADKSCEMCHAPAKDGKVVLTQADSKALCVTCHDEQAKRIDTAKVPHPGAQAGDCLSCHNPHASPQPGLPKTDAVSICLDCHSDVAELGKKKVHHQPAFAQGCATCHEGHGSDNQHLLRASSVNKLCLECHGPDSKPQRLEEAHLVTIFNGKVKLPENYFNKVVILPLKYGLGHPVDRHPVSDVMDPSNVSQVKTQVNCLSCHQPHSSTQAGLLVKDQANNMAFCSSCHKSFVR